MRALARSLSRSLSLSPLSPLLSSPLSLSLLLSSLSSPLSLSLSPPLSLTLSLSLGLSSLISLLYISLSSRQVSLSLLSLSFLSLSSLHLYSRVGKFHSFRPPLPPPRLSPWDTTHTKSSATTLINWPVGGGVCARACVCVCGVCVCVVCVHLRSSLLVYLQFALWSPHEHWTINLTCTKWSNRLCVYGCFCVTLHYFVKEGVSRFWPWERKTFRGKKESEGGELLGPCFSPKTRA